VTTLTKSTVYLLLGTTVTFVVLFLFLGFWFACVSSAAFVAGYSYTRDHNFSFYATFLTVIAVLYFCTRAGFPWLGYLGLVAYYSLVRWHRFQDAKPDEQQVEPPPPGE